MYIYIYPFQYEGQWGVIVFEGGLSILLQEETSISNKGANEGSGTEELLSLLFPVRVMRRLWVVSGVRQLDFNLEASKGVYI